MTLWQCNEVDFMIITKNKIKLNLDQMRFLLTNCIINSKFISFFFNLKLKNKYFNLFFFYLLLLLAFSLLGRERSHRKKSVYRPGHQHTAN